VIDSLVTIQGGRYPESLVYEAAALLKNHAVVVHPTETVHGYGCRYDSADAVERIRCIKESKQNKPMILLVPGKKWVDILCRNIPELAWRLIELFWPGPLTVVFQARAGTRKVCPWLGETVALRQNAHPFTSRVLTEFDLPIVSTSLNRSGQPSPGNLRRYMEDLARKHNAEPRLRPELIVLDEKLTQGNAQPSTVVSIVNKKSVRLIREGALSAAQIAEKAGIKTIGVFED